MTSRCPVFLVKLGVKYREMPSFLPGERGARVRPFPRRPHTSALDRTRRHVGRVHPAEPPPGGSWIAAFF